VPHKKAETSNMLFNTIADHDLALARIVSLREAAQLAGCSEDTLKRRHASKIIRISPRRLGMRLRDALLMTEDGKARASP
jgi:hypothetical protein